MHSPNNPFRTRWFAFSASILLFTATTHCSKKPTASPASSPSADADAAFNENALLQQGFTVAKAIADAQLEALDVARASEDSKLKVTLKATKHTEGYLWWKRKYMRLCGTVENITAETIQMSDTRCMYHVVVDSEIRQRQAIQLNYADDASLRPGEQMELDILVEGIHLKSIIPDLPKRIRTFTLKFYFCDKDIAGDQVKIIGTASVADIPKKL